MVIRIWMCLLTLALVSASAELATTDFTAAEIVELAEGLDDALTETDAPEKPPAARPTRGAGCDDALPSSPPVAQIFRPPRVRS